MITRPTVFILGAGASVPYGFPSGADLISMMVSGQIPDELSTHLQQELGADAALPCERPAAGEARRVTCALQKQQSACLIFGQYGSACWRSLLPYSGMQLAN